MRTPWGDLAETLKVLASPTRLELLHVLRMPKALHDIRVSPSLSRKTENPGRPLTRQTVSHHLEVLKSAGLVHRTSAGSNDPNAFVLNHERVFTLVDQVRNIGG